MCNLSFMLRFSRPDTQRFLERLRKQQEAKLNAEESDNRPFVLKYVRRSIRPINFPFFRFLFSGNISYQLSSFSFFKALLPTMPVVGVVGDNRNSSISFFLFFIRSFVILISVCLSSVNVLCFSFSSLCKQVRTLQTTLCQSKLTEVDHSWSINKVHSRSSFDFC